MKKLLVHVQNFLLGECVVEDEFGENGDQMVA